jgi:hypothetical protein
VWRRWDQATELGDELDWWRLPWVDGSATANVWDGCLGWMGARMAI